MVAFASRPSMYSNVALDVVEVSVVHEAGNKVSQTSSQARVGYGFKTTSALVCAAKVGGVTQ